MVSVLLKMMMIKYTFRGSKEVEQVAKNSDIKELDKLDKATEKQKKKLRRKVRFRNGTIILLLIIIILLLLSYFYTPGVGIRFVPLIQEMIDDSNSNDDHENMYVTMPVADDFTVSSEKPSIILYSPEQNKGLFYIYYTFINEDGEEIYKSEAVEGGNKFIVNFKELLGVGEHKATVRISSRFVDTMEEANGTETPITITVLE